MQIQPYLFFEGRCEEAINFYKKAIGAELVFQMRFSESPEKAGADCGPIDPNKIMHATIKIGESIVMLSDGRCQSPAQFKGFSLSISVKDEAQADRAFAALAEGGSVMMPLTRTFWSPKFGMATDQFGVLWMVSVEHGENK